MKVRTRFTLATLVFCLVFCLIGASLLYTYAEVERISGQEALAHDIVRGSYELSYLASDFFLHPDETRQNIQWDTRFRSVSTDISRLQPVTPEQKGLVRRISSNKDRLKEIYTQSVLTIGNRTGSDPGFSELRDIAWSRSIVQAQAMVFDASLLSRILAGEAARLQEVETVLVLLLMGALVIFLISNYVFIRRRVLQSISALRDGFRVIGTGDLSFRLDTGRDDELGDLSRSFNRMAEDLQDVTALKSDLEREAGERVRVEEALRKASDTLEQQVRDRTALLTDANRNLAKEIDERRQVEKALQESEGQFREFFNSAGDAIVIHDMQGQILEVNQEICRRLGYTRGEMLSMHPRDLDEPEYGEQVSDRLMELGKKGSTLFETVHVTRNGKRIPTEVSSRMIRFHGNPAVLSTGRDITERKEAEREMMNLLSEVIREREQFSSLINSISDEVWLSDTSGRFTLANPVAQREFEIGSDEETDVGTLASSLEVLRADGTPRPVEEAPPLRALTGEVIRSLEEIVRTPATHELRYRLVSAAPVRDGSGEIIGAVSVVRDITERKKAEEAVRESLAEKEVLLREVHHRVKNNLASIVSLIALQADQISDPGQGSMLRDLETRVRSMALVHEMLYQSPSLHSVSAQRYMEALTSHLAQSFSTPCPVTWEIRMGDSSFPLDLAIPCGLIVTEIVTNSLKYAFTNPAHGGEGSSCGRITLTLTEEEKSFVLFVSDNGGGIPAGLDLEQTRTLGLFLVRILTKNQLRGTLSMDMSHGLAYTIKFPKNPGDPGNPTR